MELNSNPDMLNENNIIKCTSEAYKESETYIPTSHILFILDGKESRSKLQSIEKPRISRRDLDIELQQTLGVISNQN